jgi:hypothetical protein
VLLLLLLLLLLLFIVICLYYCYYYYCYLLFIYILLLDGDIVTAELNMHDHTLYFFRGTRQVEGYIGYIPEDVNFAVCENIN